jgi:hypothetical protein
MVRTEWLGMGIGKEGYGWVLYRANVPLSPSFRSDSQLGEGLKATRGNFNGK